MAIVLVLWGLIADGYGFLSVIAKRRSQDRGRALVIDRHGGNRMRRNYRGGEEE